LSKRGVICPLSALDYVVPLRTDYVACSTGGAVISVCGIKLT
jgi:hypothetical protein